MTCLTLTCLMALFSPSNLYVTGQLYSPLNDQQRHYEGAWCTRRFCRGPVGELRMGFRAELTDSLEIDLGLTHRSYVQEGDRGQEYAFASLTWRPFRP